MPATQSAGRKRCLEPLQLEEISQPQPKRAKVDHDAVPPSSRFWDRLSTVPLVKRALQELDRRNALTGSTTSNQRRDRWPDTRRGQRRALVETRRTVQNLRRFASNGGPDLSFLRGYRKAACTPLAMSSTRSGPSRDESTAPSHATKQTPKTGITKNTSPYDRAFQQYLIDGGVYPDGYEFDDDSVPAGPVDEDKIREVLARTRASLSPSKFTQEEFAKFKRADRHTPKEKQTSESVIPLIEGSSTKLRSRAGGIPFTNLDQLIDDPLTSSNPDVYYGARPERLERKIRDELSKHIVPSTQHELPVAPNFVVAVKGRDGSLAVAERQACHDGAVAARGMHSLTSYGQDQPVYNHTAAISFTYHGGQLKMFAHHVAEPREEGGRPEYHMTQLRSFALTDTLNTCRAGMAAYRNGRDWAEEQRNKAIDQANKMVSAPIAAGANFSFATSFGSDASTDETYTMEPLSQESGSLFDDVSQTTSRSSARSVASEKRARGQPARSSRKRRPAAELSARSPLAAVATPPAPAPATSPIQAWSWADGKYFCFVGGQVVKQQNHMPSDVWVFSEHGWSDQEDKKYMCVVSATGVAHYS